MRLTVVSKKKKKLGPRVPTRIAVSAIVKEKEKEKRISLLKE